MTPQRPTGRTSWTSHLTVEPEHPMDQHSEGSPDLGIPRDQG